MAISQTSQVLTVLQETAAYLISISRTPTPNPETGKVDIIFGARINYATNQYTGTDFENLTSFIGSTDQDRFDLNEKEVQDLFNLPVTVEGADTTFGELFAKQADKLIQARLNAKEIQRITPAVLRVATTNPDPTFSVTEIPGCTYAWTISDPTAILQVNGNLCAVQGGVLPMTLTCTATQTLTSLQASFSMSV
jgi:hypothetical protein